MDDANDDFLLELDKLLPEPDEALKMFPLESNDALSSSQKEKLSLRRRWRSVRIRTLLWRYSFGVRMKRIWQNLKNWIATSHTANAERFRYWRQVTRIRTKLVWRRFKRAGQCTRNRLGYVGTYLYKHLVQPIRWRARLRLVMMKVRKTIRASNQNTRLTLTTFALIVSFVVLAFWLNWMAGGVMKWFSSFPLHYIWWGLGIGVVVAVAALIIRAIWTAPRGATGYPRRTLGWSRAIITLVVLMIGIGVYRFFSQPDKVAPTIADTTFTVVAEKDKWTKVYDFPPYMIVDIRGSQTGRWSMTTQSGATYNFTPEKSDVVPGAITKASFMALGESPENIRIRLSR